MHETPLEQLPSLPQQAPAIDSLHPPSICIDRSAVIALVANHFFDALQMRFGLRTRFLDPDQLRYVFTRLGQSLHHRRRISQIRFLQGHRQHRSGLQIHGVLGFVRPDVCAHLSSW